MNSYTPLVSIVVITYNSSKYVLETLESSKAQTYKNIELIVSDDCSTDNTVEICNQWINENKKWFVRTELITSNINTGIAPNCNRGVKASLGEWIKLIAGDDMLLKDCIYDYIHFIKENQESVLAIHANMNVFTNNFQPDNFISCADYSSSVFNLVNITANQQFVLLLRNVYIGGPTSFLKRSLLIDLGGFDEEMPYEDWPMFIKITKNGYKIHYINKTTVNYRINNNSFYNNSYEDSLLFNDFFIRDKIVFKRYRKKDLKWHEKYLEQFEFARKLLFMKFGLNKANFINRIINTPFDLLYKYCKKASFYRVKRKIANNHFNKLQITT